MIIPIFFAVDDGYCPFLAVAIQSLIDNSSPENTYLIKVLNTDITEENKKRISKYERDNVDIEFVDLTYYIQKVKDKLYTRDYYSKTTYFRLFLPNLYLHDQQDQRGGPCICDDHGADQSTGGFCGYYRRAD